MFPQCCTLSFQVCSQNIQRHLPVETMWERRRSVRMQHTAAPWDYWGEATTECCLYKIVWNITVQTYINKTVGGFHHRGKMLPVSNRKSRARLGTPGKCHHSRYGQMAEWKMAWNSNFDRTVPLNMCTNKWHSPLRWRRLIFSRRPTPCRASLDEILSAVYDNVFSLPMQRQQRRAFPLAAALREIGTGERAFPRGIVFLEWWPCGDEKQSAKPLTDAVITWRTQAYRECDAPSVIPLIERQGQDPIQTHEGCKQTNNALNREWTALRLTMIEQAQIAKRAHNAAGHDVNGNGFRTYSRTHTVKFGC